MKATDYLKWNRKAGRIFSELDAYMYDLCRKKYEWNQISVYDIPLLQSPNYRGHRIAVTLSIPTRKVKYWLDGRNVETDNYYGFDDEDFASAIAGWTGRAFLAEFYAFI